MTCKLWLILAPNDDCNLSDEYSNIRHYFTPTFTDETDYGTFQVINFLPQSPANNPPTNIYNLLLPFPKMMVLWLKSFPIMVSSCKPILGCNGRNDLYLIYQIFASISFQD